MRFPLRTATTRQISPSMPSLNATGPDAVVRALVAICRGRVGGTHMCRKPAPAAEFGLYPDRKGQTPEAVRIFDVAREASQRTPADSSVEAATASHAAP